MPASHLSYTDTSLRSTPSGPTSLFEGLQAISDLLNAAVAKGHVPFAFTLNESVRRHLVTPLRKRLYQSCHRPYSQPYLDAPFEERTATTCVYQMLSSVMSQEPPTSLPQALDEIQRTVTPLPVTDLAFQVLSKVWDDLVVILRSHLHLWCTCSVVEDPRHQFFISDQSQPRVVPERLPQFISPAVADRFLFIGNARKCRIVLAKERREPLDDPGDIPALCDIMTNPISAELEIEAASLKWREEAAESLSQILPIGRIRNRIVLLRQYLLLGDSIFWRSFFDELRAKPSLLSSRDLEPRERNKVQRSISDILSYTFDDFASENSALAEKSAPWDSILKLHVTPTGDLVPQFTLGFAESRVLASKASVYCDVFAITFNIRRVGCELRDAYAKIQLLEHQLRQGPNLQTRRQRTSSLVQIRELRRIMGMFIDGFEWYLQVEVLEPNINKVLNLLDTPTRKGTKFSDSPDKPFFDVIYSTHETVMNDIFSKCFVGQRQINARLNGIFASCFSLSDFVQELTVEALKNNSFADTLSALEQSFSRNVGLLVRLLLRLRQDSADSGIPALLDRISFRQFHNR